MDGPRVLLRRAGFLLAAAGLLIAMAATAAVGESTILFRAPAIADSPALQTLSACLAEKKTGDLVVLIDTSGSLSGAGDPPSVPTDPTDVRVAGAQALLGGLADSFDRIEANVDVTVAGFADDVTTAVAFTPLTGSALPGLDDQLAQFSDWDRGAETDYWTALNWLNQTLQDKVQQRPGGPGSTCQFAIWFTDGEFTISPRDGKSDAGLDPLTPGPKTIPGFEDNPLTDGDSTNAAKVAARGELCRAPGGTADQMRAAGITLIGVGLGGEDADRFGFVRDYTENPDGSCGALPGVGVFVPVTSVGELFLQLSALGDLDQTTTTDGGHGLCQGQPCPEGSYTFKLDNTISAVHLAAVVDDGSRALIRAGIEVVITPPGGEPVTIVGDGPDTGAASTDLAEANFEWYSGGPLGVELIRGSGKDWTGDWKITFVDTTGEHPNAVSNIVVTLTSDFAIAPVPVDPDSWRVGQSAAVRFQPQTLDGAPIELSQLPVGFHATARVHLPGADRQVIEVPVSLTEPSTIDLPSDGNAGLAIVAASIDGQVAGQALGTVTRQATVTVQPPFDAPQVVPPDQDVDFGSIEGTATASGTLSVQGPEEGAGCVTVASGQVQGSPGVSAQIATSGATECFPVPAGQSVQIPLTLTPSTQGSVPLTGAIVVDLSPQGDPDRVSQQMVRFHLDMKRLPNPEARLAVLIAALLVGLLIPLLVMWLVRRMSARFPPAQAATLQSVALDVQVGGGRLTSPDGGQLAAPADGWSAVLPPGPGRRTLVLSGVPLRARAGWRLSEPGYAEVDDRAGADSVGAGGDSLPPHDGKGHPRLPLAVQGTWLVLAPRQLAVSPIEVVQARLVLVVDTAADPAKRAVLAGRAVAEAPEAFDEARRRARDATGTPEPPHPPTPVPAGGGWGPLPSGPAGPSGSPPSPGWGAAPQSGSGGGGSTPGWGAPNPPAAGGGWGPPPSGPAGGTPPGWGPPGAGPDDRRRDPGWPG